MANSEYARKTFTAAVEGGASIVVMCDTNGGSMPEEVAALTKEAAAVESAQGGQRAGDAMGGAGRPELS
jgi:2-isopropylmalate synthase